MGYRGAVTSRFHVWVTAEGALTVGSRVTQQRHMACRLPVSRCESLEDAFSRVASLSGYDLRFPTYGFRSAQSSCSQGGRILLLPLRSPFLFRGGGRAE